MLVSRSAGRRAFFMRLMPPLLVPLGAALVAFGFGPNDPAQQGTDEIADLVEAGADGVFRFRVTDSGGELLPCRLTFLGPDGPQAELFDRVEAAPKELAVRRNVIYTRSGAGAVTLPVGRYSVIASHGLEWGLAGTELEIKADEPVRWQAQLEREIDTSGWISGDFHLHTLTYSGHGDANLEERIISLIGEGLEFAVATDHNHNTDYAETIQGLGVSQRISSVVGNEVSTSIGHFNAFPLDAARAPVDESLTDAGELFRLIRSEPNAFGVTPIIQLNHPRWAGIDYFALTHLDPVTGVSSDPAYSGDFDAIELLNENEGWGYFDPFATERGTGSNLHSVLEDWFHLLNQGARYAGVGNSDSHSVIATVAGVPRNYVRSKTDVPAEIDPAQIAQSIREKRVFTTTGPFLEVRSGQVGMGGGVRATDGKIPLSIRLQAASWIDVDRVHLILNGDRIRTIDVPDSRDPVRLLEEFELSLRERPEDDSSPARDAWIVLLAEGDTPLDPLVVGSDERPILPLAVTNPIWIDGDGDGQWIAPAERAREILAGLAGGASERFIELFSRPGIDRVLLLNGIEPDDEELFLSALLDGVQDDDRRVRLAALRRAEAFPSPVVRQLLAEAWAPETEDPYVTIAFLRALAANEDPRFTERFLEWHEHQGEELAGPYARELLGSLPGTPIEGWIGLGLFPAPEAGTIAGADPGPEAAFDGEATYPARDGEASWRELAIGDGGYLDLKELAPEGASSDQAFAYAQTGFLVNAAAPRGATLRHR